MLWSLYWMASCWCHYTEWHHACVIILNVVVLSLYWMPLCWCHYTECRCDVVIILNIVVLLSLYWMSLCCCHYTECRCAVVFVMNVVVLLSLYFMSLCCCHYTDCRCAVIIILSIIMLSNSHTFRKWFNEKHYLIIGLMARMRVIDEHKALIILWLDANAFYNCWTLMASLSCLTLTIYHLNDAAINSIEMDSCHETLQSCSCSTWENILKLNALLSFTKTHFAYWYYHVRYLSTLLYKWIQ
jgi:hypothetical protein